MASQQLSLGCDSSSVANFKNWAKAVDDWFGSLGWSRTSDTGQVDWTTIAAVPGSGSYVYSIWQSPGALTTYYVKMEYGNNGGTNNPSIKVGLGTGTNGSGTLTGFTFTNTIPSSSIAAKGSGTTTYECNFSGDGSNRLAVMMWRTGDGSTQQFSFGIERSLDNSGSYTGDYVTIAGIQHNSSDGNWGRFMERSSLASGLDPTKPQTHPRVDLSRFSWVQGRARIPSTPRSL